MEISWLDYLFANKREQLFEVIRSYDLPIPQDYSELYECIDLIIERYGDEAERRILKIHPDYDPIKKMINEESKVNYHNFNGEIDGIKDEMSKEFQIQKLENEICVLKRNSNIMYVVVGFLFYHTFLNKK